MHTVLAILGPLLISFIWWVLVFPILWIFTTPIILIVAAFRHGPYGARVSELYRAVTEFWKDHGFGP
jgi:hypothetical protein